MSELPPGYREVPEEDRAKAAVFFEYGRAKAATGSYEYSIEMYMQGLALDPDAVEAHQELRDMSLKRKASGGKGMGMLGSMKYKRPSSDDKQNMLNAERMLAFEPGDTNYMQAIFQSAYRAGYYDTAMWIGPILKRANIDDKKPDYAKFILLRDIYKALKQWGSASDACQFAFNLHPDDMELATEMKNLAAQSTLEDQGYARRGNFRDQIRDKSKQELLLMGDMDVGDADHHRVLIAQAQQESAAEPNDPSKAMKLVDALEKSESSENETRAVEILQHWFDKTGQFRYRQRIGLISMKQLSRMERTMRAELQADPANVELQKNYTDFLKEKNEHELHEFEMAVQAYPTENRLRNEMGRRLFALGRFADAIPVFQQSRNDPKFRVEATVFLGQSFLEAGYLDEADETLAQIIKEYPLTGDLKAKEMYYSRGRVLELKNLNDEAKNHYSKVAQWDFNYRDVQGRLKNLRG